jgi:hypothetical protein
MTDTILGAFCVLLGAALAVFGVVVLVFGVYTLAVGHAGGWWIVELLYVFIGAGLAFVGVFSSRHGLGLLRHSNKHNAKVRDGPAT